MDRREREEFARIERELAGSDPEFGSSVTQMRRPSLVPARALRALLASGLLFGLTTLAIETGLLLLAVLSVGASLAIATRWMMLMRVFLRSRPPLLLPSGELVEPPVGPHLVASAVLFVAVASVAMMLVVLLFS